MLAIDTKSINGIIKKTIPIFTDIRYCQAGNNFLKVKNQKTRNLREYVRGMSIVYKMALELTDFDIVSKKNNNNKKIIVHLRV